MIAANQSLFGYFLDAGPVVKAVMFLLLIASVASWTFIFQRHSFLKKARQIALKFEDKFWSGTDLTKLYTHVDERAEEQQGLASIFHAGFREFMRLRKQSDVQHTIMMESVQRSMRIANAKEMEKLEKHLPFLASVGSTSPYVGLFGTVWGIMTSFQALGAVQQASVSMVAPGISEALIATAMGLFAAIPAVLAYNRYSSKVEILLNQYDTFQEELYSILQRQAHQIID